MSRLSQGIDFAIGQVPTSGDLSRLSSDVRTVLLVHAAQGLIDNGGFQYFFESDFPKRPPYSVFVDAYRAIGAEPAAATLERAVALFPFPDAHRSMRKRNDYMNSFRDTDGRLIGSPFEKLTASLSDEEQVWKRLGDFIEERRASFGLA